MNETDVKIKFRNSVTNFKRLQEYEQKLKSLKNIIENMPKNFSLGNNIDKKLETTNKLLVNLNKNMSSFKRSTTSTLGNMNKDVSQMNKHIKKLGANSKNSGEQMKKAFKIQSFKQLSNVFLRLVTNMSKFTNKSAEYLENLNLLEVAFSGNTTEAKRFVESLTEMYGLDESWGYRTVGLFKQLANAMGLSNETGIQLSKTLTQLAIDTSSLYNIDVRDTVSILQSGLAGQTKPVRRLGADITQTSLQTTLDTYGIERSINTLSYAEKRLVIVATLINQTQQATNDFGKTIESIANQMRVFQQQTERLTRALGNMFLPILKTLLPYINAFMMVLTEIITQLAYLFGYSDEEFSFGAGVNLDLEEMKGNLDGANESAQKLQRSLRSFDKLNNITTPSASGGVGSGNGLGIDEDIMGLFNSISQEYLDNITKVEMKATQIRDAIMETLGFQKEVNVLTGEVSWTYLGWESTVKGLWEWFKKLTPLAKIFVGLAVGKALLGIYGAFEKLMALDLVKKFFSPYQDLVFDIKKNGVLGGAKLWATTTSKVEKLTIGLQGTVTGLLLMQDALKRNNKTLGDWLLTIGESTLATLNFAMAGAQIGSFFGPTGALVGGLVGIFGGFATSLYSASKGLKINTELGKEYMETMAEVREQALANANHTLVEMERAQELSVELEKLVDSKGKVKKEDEDRVEFILNQLNKAYGTEYKLVDGMITKNGKEKISYQKLQEEIDKTYEAKKREIKLKAYEDIYNEALKQRIDISKQLKQKQETLEFTQQRYNEALKYGTDQYGVSADELEKSIDRQKKQIESLQTSYNNSQMEVLAYEELLQTSSSENVEEFEKALEEYENGTLITTEEMLDNYKKNMDETTLEITEKMEKNIKKWFPEKKTTKYVIETALNDEKFRNVYSKISKAFEPMAKALGITLPKMPVITESGKTQSGSGRRYKTGISFVPNDFYPAYLDYGERVLTRQQNEDYNKGIINGVTATSQPMNATFIIQVGNEEVARKVVNDLHEMAKSNGEPITIGA